MKDIISGLVAIQHRMNPLHVYGRFVERGYWRGTSSLYCNAHEIRIFSWVKKAFRLALPVTQVFHRINTERRLPRIAQSPCRNQDPLSPQAGQGNAMGTGALKQRFPISTATDKRRTPRIETSHVVSYICLDEGGNKVSEGLGRAINLSRSGVRMETLLPVETPRILLLVAGLCEESLQTKGKVVYGHIGEKNKYIYGIQIFESSIRREELFVRMLQSKDTPPV